MRLLTAGSLVRVQHGEPEKALAYASAFLLFTCIILQYPSEKNLSGKCRFRYIAVKLRSVRVGRNMKRPKAFKWLPASVYQIDELYLATSAATVFAASAALSAASAVKSTAFLSPAAVVSATATTTAATTAK
jgi:hypothetical protein